MAKEPDQANFLDHIRASELGAKIIADIDAARIATRKQIAERLAGLHKNADATFPKLNKEVDKAHADYIEAEKRFQQARHRLALAQGARSSASATFAAERDDLTHQLKQTAAPSLAAAIHWAGDEQARTRKHLRTRYWTERHPVTGRTVDRVESNHAAIQKRVAALGELIEALQAAQLAFDDTKASELIERLRNELPEVKEI